jgi:hypothetical protein
VVKSAQELLKEKIEKVRQEDEKERQIDPEKEYQWALLRGVTKRCRLYWLTNCALVHEPKCGGGGGVSCGVSANEYSRTQEFKETLEI